MMPTNDFKVLTKFSAVSFLSPLWYIFGITFTSNTRFSIFLKLGTPIFSVDLTFEWYEDVMVFYVIIFIVFCSEFEQTARKETWIKVNIRVPSQQLRGTFTRAFWKTLYSQLKILRTWIKTRAKSLLKTWVNIIKQKSTKVPGKLSVAQKSEILASFSLKQT